MAINCYNINNNSFHGHQISNLNIQELLIIIIISLFAHSDTMIVSIEHSKTHSMYKYNNYIQQLYITV